MLDEQNTSNYGQNTQDQESQIPVLAQLMAAARASQAGSAGGGVDQQDLGGQGQVSPGLASPQALSPEEKNKRRLNELLMTSRPDIMRKLTGFDQESIDRRDAANPKHPKIAAGGRVAGNILMALLGRDFGREADQEFNSNRKIVEQGQAGQRSDELAESRAETARRLGEKDKMINASGVANRQLKAELNANEIRSKETIATQKDATTALRDLAKDRTDSGRLKVQQAAQELKEKYPDLNITSALHAAFTDSEGNLDVAGFTSALQKTKPPASSANKFDKVVADVADSSGSIIGKNITNIPRVSGTTFLPSGTAENGGNTTLSPQQVKEVSAIRPAARGATLAAQNILQDYGSGKLKDYTGLIKGSDFMTFVRASTGDTSTGEATEDFFGPTNVIQHIRSLSPRLNQKEITEFTKVIGKKTNNADVIAMKAMLYSLTMDVRLNEALGRIPNIPGSTKKLHEAPEFVQSMREAIEKSLVDAKKNGKIPTAIPTFATIESMTQRKLKMKNSGAGGGSTSSSTYADMVTKAKAELVKMRGGK